MSKELEAAVEFAANVEQRLELFNRDLARIEGARETVAGSLKDATDRLSDNGDEVEILDAVGDLLQGMEGAFQHNFQRTLAAIVSEGLSQVFGEELEVRIETSTKADMSAIRFRLIKDGNEEDIMEGQGGGYINIIAFLLRVLLILAARPLLRRLLILDEPFAHVSPEFRQSTAEMVQALIDRLDFQMVMVTQEWEYVEVADRAYKATLPAGGSRFDLLKGEAPEEVAVE